MSEKLPDVPVIDAAPSHALGDIIAGARGRVVQPAPTIPTPRKETGAVVSAAPATTEQSDPPAPKRKKLSGAQRRKLTRQSSTRLQSAVSAEDERRQQDEAARVEKEKAAAERARAELVLQGDGRAQLEKQVGSLLALVFVGTGYALGDTKGRVWPITGEQEKYLGVLFVQAHGLELSALLEGGMLVKALAWGTLLRIAGEKWRQHRELKAGVELVRERADASVAEARDAAPPKPRPLPDMQPGGVAA